MRDSRKVGTMNQPRSFAQREDAGKKKVTKDGAISRRIERSEIDGSKSGPKGVARRRHPVERVVPWGRLCEEQEVTTDAGYQGVEKREEMVAGARGVEWQIVANRGQAWQSQIDGGGEDQGADSELGAGESSSAGEGGASFPCPEKPLPPSKNAVSRAGEKSRPASPSLRPCQPLLGNHRNPTQTGSIKVRHGKPPKSRSMMVASWLSNTPDLEGIHSLKIPPHEDFHQNLWRGAKGQVMYQKKSHGAVWNGGDGSRFAT